MQEDDEYVRQFRDSNLPAIRIPPLVFNYRNENLIVDWLLNVSNNCTFGIILTSPRAVQAIARVLRSNPHLKEKIELLKSRIYTIGTQTAKKLESELSKEYDRQSAQCKNSRELGLYLSNIFSIEKTPCNLLYPKSSRAQLEIEDALIVHSHVRIVGVDAYDTSYREDIRPKLSQIITDHGANIPESIDMVVNIIFFSPSGVDALVASYGNRLEALKDEVLQKCQFKYTAIGSTTAKYLITMGLEVYCVAKEPTPAGLVASLMEAS